MVQPEIETLFGLNINEHVKWLIYTTLWRQCYGLRDDVKVELESKALFFLTLLEYKSRFHPDEEFSERINIVDFDNETRDVQVINNTHYYDAMLFDLQMMVKEKFNANPEDVSEEIANAFVPFSYSILNQIDEEVQFDMLTVSLRPLDGEMMTERRKLELVYALWMSLNAKEWQMYYEKMKAIHVHVFYPMMENIEMFL